MSLKDEIEKLIQAEQQKLDIEDQKDKERHQRQKESFKPLAVLLKEVASSVGHEFLETAIIDSYAMVKVGRRDNECFHEKIVWEIYPEPAVFGYQENGEIGFIEKDGDKKTRFIVKETEYFDMDIDQDSLTFETEQEVIEYVIKKISKEVAHQRRLKKS